MTINQVDTNYCHNELNKAKIIEEIICLAILIFNGILKSDATIENAAKYYNDYDHGCNDCPFFTKCLACIINE
jgi:hypothetical protein